MVMIGLLFFSKLVISMLFLGRLGEAELAGGSMAMAFANISGNSVLMGLALGMEPICGQAYGARRWAVLTQALHKTILLLLLVTVPVSIIWLNVHPILLKLGQDTAITSIASDYLLCSLPDLVAQALLHPLSIFLRTQNHTKALTFATAFAALLHIPANYFFVFYLGWGVKGVAIASVCNTINSDLGIMVFLFVSDNVVNIWTGLSTDCLRGWGRLLKLGLPSAIAVCLEWWWYEVMLLLCGLLPDPKSSVAAMGILMQTTGIMYVFPASLGMGLATRVGNELGARRPAAARRAAAVGLALAATGGSMAFVFVSGMRGAWGRMFTDDPVTLALTATALPIVGLCELGNSPQTAGCGVLRGSARPETGAHINLGAFYLVGMPVAVVAGFPLGLGLRGLWFGLVAAQASCVCLVLWAIARTDWEKEATKAEALAAEGTIDGRGGGRQDGLQEPLVT
ncbi:protein DETOXIFICATION 53 [Curcuma longa]|uniref:protein DETOXIFICATION 53 n=1 Tax=Curcuma longa TaxID=136217 RepID=UPI003D9E08CB